jgi:polyhydroxyalkanoate synthesis regulator protein
MNEYVHQLFSKVIFETKLDYTRKDLNKLIKEFEKFNIKNTDKQSDVTKSTVSKYILNNIKFKTLKIF